MSEIKIKLSEILTLEEFEELQNELWEYFGNIAKKNIKIITEELIKIWCTKCDINMIKKGIALDCPIDGIFYICPICKNRIVFFKGDDKENGK